MEHESKKDKQLKQAGCGCGCGENGGRCDCVVLHSEAVEAVRKQMPSGADFNEVSGLYKMFADPTRAKILWALSQDKLCVCDLAALLDMTKSAVSHSLALLKLSNLVKSEKKGKISYYMPADEHVYDILSRGFKHVFE